ncbi:MAG: helix-turn-helix domain-containing protein [Verrucomicrobiae bacterium]|nr:helix-turn-helix domain-containing protein [Verrucomicrobiae bacterium]
MTDLSDTIGSRLRVARESKGMTIDDAAFETRIQAPYLRALENDDYSGFASTTYAKSFLSLYSRYLGVDAHDAIQYFDSGHSLRLSGAAILPTLSSSGPVESGPTRKEPAKVRVREDSPGLAPVLLGVFVLALVAGIPLLWYLGKDAESIDDVASKAKAIQEEISTAANAIEERLPVGAPAPAQPSEPEAKPKTEVSPESSATPSKEGDTAPKSVAAEWVLDSQKPRPSTSIAPLTSDGPDAADSSPAEPDQATSASPKFAAVTPPKSGTGRGLDELAPAPLRATPSQPSSNSPSSPKPAPAKTPEPTTSKEAASDPEVDQKLLATPSSGASTDLPSGMVPIHANPIGVPAEMPELSENNQPTAPADLPIAKPTTTGPAKPTPAVIRATPLIAVPISIAEDPGITTGEDDASASSDETKEKEKPFVDPKNRFPRPVEP